MRTCDMTECEEKHVAKGLCDPHRQQAKRLGVQCSVQALTEAIMAQEERASSPASPVTGKGYEDAMERPWEAGVKRAQARARGQRADALESEQRGLAAFPPQSEQVTAAFGTQGWSTGTHAGPCKWNEKALTMFQTRGVPEYLEAGGPQACLDGHSVIVGAEA